MVAVPKCYAVPTAGKGVTFLEEEELDLHLVERYLASWARYGSMDHLREAWALARPLGVIHRSIIYHHAIQHLGPGPEEMSLNFAADTPIWGL